MCKYRYSYYVNCCHSELYRTSYCEEAIALGLPERDDCWRNGLQHTNSDSAKRSNPLSVGCSSMPDSNVRLSRTFATNTLQDSRRGLQMRTATQSKAGSRHSWADSVAASEPERPHGADYISRSIQPDQDHYLPNTPASPHVYYQRTSQAISPLDTSGSNSNSDFNMNITLDPHSSFQVELTHKDGKVQEIVTRFESLEFRNASDGNLSDRVRTDAGGDHTHASTTSSLDNLESHLGNRTIRECLVYQKEKDHIFASEKPIDVLHQGVDTETPIQGILDTDSNDTSSIIAEGGAAQPDKIKGTLHDGPRVELQASHLVESSTRNLQKSLPKQTTAKPKAPTLATAGRAAHRQSRKSASKNTSPAEANHRPPRGTRSLIDVGKTLSTGATAFLTKDAVSPMESNIASPAHTSRRLLQSPSKSSPSSPAGSPVRSSPKQGSKISIRVKRASPTKLPSKESNYDLDGSGYSVFKDGSKHTRAAGSFASTTGATPFVSAHPSPSSLVSFCTAHSQPEESIPDLDLANASGGQISTGMKTHSHHHGRVKAESHLGAFPKAKNSTLTKPPVPQLSLKIPLQSPISTNRKPIFTLGPAKCPGSATPGSPSTSSRIPRKSASVQGDTEQSITSPRRAQSTKSFLLGKSVDENKKDAKASMILNQEGMYAEERGDPSTIPLPDTPAVTILNYIQSLGSQDLKSFLAFRSSRKDENEWLKAENGLKSDDNPDRLTRTDSAIEKVSAYKHSIIENYLEQTAGPSELPSKPNTPVEETGSAAPSQELVRHGPFAFVSNPGAHQREQDDRADDKESMSRIESQNIISKDTRMASEAREASMTDPPSEPDPVLNDPAIIYSRAKTDASGTSHSNPIQDETSSVKSGSTKLSTMSRAQQNTVFLHKGAQPSTEKPRWQTCGEISFRSLLPSDLRGDAAVFVPQKQSATDRPGLPKEWMQPYVPAVPFNPFELDVLQGIPLYYHMNHSVNVGDGTSFNYRNYARYGPFKKDKNKRFYGTQKRCNHRKTRSTDTTSSPTKSRETEDTNLAVEIDESVKKTEAHATPRSLNIALAGLEGSTTEEQPAVVESSPSKPPPFTHQMDIVSTHITRNARGTGRGPRKIDWGSIRNVHYNHQQNMGYNHQTWSSARDNPNNYHQLHQSQQNVPNRRKYDNGRRGGHYSYSLNPPAGVPLDLTAPFPDPVAPPGTRPTRTVVEGGSPKQYIGYRIGENPSCGKIEIENGIEYGELSTLKCRTCMPDY